MLASGDLQLIILALLSEKPRHGYEIIKQVEEHSSGAYTPSPGMVYPALTYLEEMGYAASGVREGTKKLYRITETGTAYLNEKPGQRGGHTLINWRALAGSSPNSRRNLAWNTKMKREKTQGTDSPARDQIRMARGETGISRGAK